MPRSANGWYGLAAIVVVLDQLSKWVVLNHVQYGETIYVAPFWNWVLTFNPGAAFSFLADQPGWQRWFFSILALGVSGWIALELRRHPEEKPMALALTLVMGGGVRQRHRSYSFWCCRRFHSMACRRLLLASLQRCRFRNHARCRPHGLGYAFCQERNFR